MGIDIGYNIKSARNAAGLTQEELARQCGVATITIRQYESGKREPKYDTLERLADALDVPLEVLLGIGDSVKTELVPTNERQRQTVIDHVRAGLESDTTSEDVVFREGEILCGGALKVQKVIQNSDDTFSVSFSVTEKGISVDNLKALLEFMTEHDISTEGLVELVEAAAKVAPNRLRPQASTAPQSSPAPQEGKDTTPPLDAPETPENGE